MECLSPREHQVAMLIGRGLCNKEIARELRLSVGTVKLHVHHILQKTGARSRYAVLLLAATMLDHRCNAMGAND
jgi:DNA-binding NarL/FixJ family response regulator